MKKLFKIAALATVLMLTVSVTASPLDTQVVAKTETCDVSFSFLPYAVMAFGLFGLVMSMRAKD